MTKEDLRFANKSIGSSGSEVNERIGRFTIVNITSSVTGIEDVQTKAYTMNDIGKLERRIQALEYYVGLSLIEKAITDLSIPSAVYPNISRFKNGFLVDSFNDYTVADVTNKDLRLAEYDGKKWSYTIVDGNGEKVNDY
mgnify:CR=1 FL=1